MVIPACMLLNIHSCRILYSDLFIFLVSIFSFYIAELFLIHFVIYARMPHSQTWPLSQGSNKLSGTCSFCFAVRQLHLKDGTVHVHGPRNNPCPGSRKLPSTSGNPLASTSSSSSQPIASLSFTPSTNIPIPPQCTTLKFFHPNINLPIIKHIPKSARAACCASLSAVLNLVSQSPNDLSAWTKLLDFGHDILRQPARGGKRHNLASTIKKRIDGAADSVSEPNRLAKFFDASASLAAAVKAKIEDGNIRAALRIISSEDKQLLTPIQTLQNCFKSIHLLLSTEDPFLIQAQRQPFK